MPLPKVSFLSKPFGALKAPKPSKLSSLPFSSNKAPKPSFTEIDAQRIVKRTVTIALRLSKKLKTATSVKVSSPGFTRDCRVTFDAGETEAYATASLVDVSGEYDATIVVTDPNAYTGQATPAKFRIVCLVAFAPQPFDVRLMEVLPGSKPKLFIELSAVPGEALTVPLKCGAITSNPSLTIPVGQASPFEVDVQLTDDFGDYTCELGKLVGCEARDEKDLVLTGPIEFGFKLGAAVTFADKPFGQGTANPAELDPGVTTPLALRMKGAAKAKAKYKLTSPGLVGSPIELEPPSPTAAAWTVDVETVKTPGSYDIKLEGSPGIKGEGSAKFDVRLLAGFEPTPFEAEPKLGAKAKLKVELSAPAPKDVTLGLRCAGFVPEKQKVKIPKGQKRAAHEVTITSTPGGYVAELEASGSTTLVTNRSRAPFRVSNADPKAVPKISFAEPPIRGGKKDVYDVGETIGFRVAFSDDAVVDGSRFKLSSDAVSSQHENHTGHRGGVDDPIVCEARIPDALYADGSHLDKTVDVALVADQGCVAGTPIKLQIKVRPPVGVELQEKDPIKPAQEEGHYPGETVWLRLALTREAPPGGARVSARSEAFVHEKLNPDGTVVVSFREGEKTGRAEVVLHARGSSFEKGKLCKVTLESPVSCQLAYKGRLETVVKIRPLPVLDFDTAWVDPAITPFSTGELATFTVKLAEPAPSHGARFEIRSTAFEEPILGELLKGETTVKLKGRLMKAATGDQDVTIVPVSDAPGCVAGPNATAKLQVKDGPKVRFASTWITPSKPVYNEGDVVTIHVELDASGPVDGIARLDCPAFNGRAYIARFPAGAVKQGEVQDKPKEDLPGKAMEFVEQHPEVLKLAMPGQLAKLATREYDKIPAPSALKVTLARVRVPTGTKLTRGATVQQELRVFGMQGCLGVDTRILKVKARDTDRASKGVVPCSQNKDLVQDEIEHCNAHRLLVCEAHGGGRIAARGHDGQGTWEIVASHAAPRRNVDAAIGAATIQVIAGKVIYEKDDEPHQTTLTVRTDPKDHFCSYEIAHPEATATERTGIDDTRQQMIKHPHLNVFQRQVRSLETLIGTGGKPTKAMEMQKEMELRQVPEYPGWVAYIEKKKKKKAAFDVRSSAEAGLVLRTVKLKKRQQKYEKLLAKGMPIKLFDTGIGIISVTDVIRSAQTIFAPRLEHYRVILETCGVPDPQRATPKVPAPSLTAKIEVYPSEEFCLFLNLTPMPAMQFGNDGHYVANGQLTSPDDPNRPVNDTQLGGDALQPVTDGLTQTGQDNPLPMGVENPLTTAGNIVATSPGGTAPLENQKATESTAPNVTTISQMESRGGGVVQTAPELDPERRGREGRDRNKGVLLKRPLEFLHTGKSHDRAKPSSSSEQRVLAKSPSTRVFHPVYPQGAFAPPPELAELDGWDTAKLGLVVNGRPKPEFMKIAQAIFAILYIVRHLADFWKSLQDSVPSWGWGVTFDMGFLEGGLRFRWGWKEFEDWRVFRWWQAEVNAVLFRASIEVWAGFKWRCLFIKFQFVAYGKIGGMLPAKFSVEREGPDGGVQWDAEFGAATTAEIGIRLILVHENFLYANAAVKTGYYFKFIFKDPTEERFGVFWEAYFMGLSIGVTFKIVQVKKIFQKEKALIEGNPPGVPQRQGTLFPRGHTSENDAFRARRALRHAWLRACAEFGKLDEALNWWHDIQLAALDKRDPEEWEEDAETDPAAEWPWTDDPEVLSSPFGNGSAMKVTEGPLWHGQWRRFRDAVEANQLKIEGDELGTGKVRKTAKKRKKLGGLGKQLAKLGGKADLRLKLIELLEHNEVAIEKMKQTMLLIDHKYIAVLREIDREVSLADDEDRPVKKEFKKQLDEAKTWGDWPRGAITKLVDEALEGVKLTEMEHYVGQLEAWTCGKVSRPVIKKG